MQLQGTIQVDTNGHLVVGGCDTVELAAEFGTPLYVIDEARLRQMARRYRSSFNNYYPDTKVAYAGKAMLTLAICKIIESEGL